MNTFGTFYILLGFSLPILGIIAVILFLFILNKIAKELKRHNDLKEKEIDLK